MMNPGVASLAKRLEIRPAHTVVIYAHWAVARVCGFAMGMGYVKAFITMTPLHLDDPFRLVVQQARRGRWLMLEGMDGQPDADQQQPGREDKADASP